MVLVWTNFIINRIDCLEPLFLWLLGYIQAPEYMKTMLRAAAPVLFRSIFPLLLELSSLQASIQYLRKPQLLLAPYHRKVTLGYFRTRSLYIAIGFFQWLDRVSLPFPWPLKTYQVLFCFHRPWYCWYISCIQGQAEPILRCGRSQARLYLPVLALGILSCFKIVIYFIW